MRLTKTRAEEKNTKRGAVRGKNTPSPQEEKKKSMGNYGKSGGVERGNTKGRKDQGGLSPEQLQDVAQ